MKFNNYKLIVIPLLITMFMLPFVSAFEFDNLKSYNPTTERITLQNSLYPLSIPLSKIADIELKSAHHSFVQEGNTGFAEMYFNNNEEVSINDVEFYDLDKIDKLSGGYARIIRPVSLQYSTLEEVRNPIYSASCINVQEKNGTKKQCTSEITGYSSDKQIVWNDLKSDVIPIGEWNIRFLTEVHAGDHIEFIPQIAGQKITEWADFSAFSPYENQTIKLDGATQAEAIYISQVTAQCFRVGDGGQNLTFTGSGTELWLYQSAGKSGNFSSVIISNASLAVGGCTPSKVLAMNSTVNFSGITSTTTGQSFNVTLPSWTSYKGAVYAVWVNSTESVNNLIRWNEDTHLGGNATSYRGGNLSGSSDGGTTWSDTRSPAVRGYFKIFGTPSSSTTASNVSVNLITPINYFNGTNLNQFFNATFLTNNANMTNATIYIWNSTAFSLINQTLNLIITNDSTGAYNFTSWNVTLPSEGNYTWNVRACSNNNTGSPCSWGDGGNRTFILDLTAPNVAISYPTSGLEIVTFTNPYNVSLNFSASDSGVGLFSCWWNNETANISVGCNKNTSVLFGGGTHNITLYANDSFNNVNSTTINFFINTISTILNLTSPVLEGENNTILFNITATNMTSISANVTYYNTNYSLITLQSNRTFIAYSLIRSAPLVNADTNNNISANFILDGVTFNTSTFQQLVYNLPNITVGVNCNPASLTFNLIDEETLIDVPGTFDYNLVYGLSNSSLVQSYGTIDNKTQFSVCINTTISNNFTLGSGMIFYRNSTTYVDRRYYLFSGLTLTNTTTNITLHDLKLSSQTSFALTVEDTSLAPYISKFTTLVRWYPSLNEYRIVDMGKTDETGSTVIHVKVEDVDYRIGVYEQNGSLITLASPIRLVCLTTPCSYTLKISPSATDFSSFLNVQYSLTYNSTNSIWTFTYSDPTLKTSTMNLSVYKQSGLNTVSVCNSAITGSSGAVTCNTTGQTGVLRAIVMRSASPPVQIVEKVISLVSSPFKSSFGLFLSFIIGLPIIGAFALVSPVAVVIGGIIALIPALYLGTIAPAVFGAFAILAGIIIHFMDWEF